MNELTPSLRLPQAHTQASQNISSSKYSDFEVIDGRLLASNYSHSRTKRLFDIVIAVTALIFFIFPSIVITIALSLRDGFPILFKHNRVGQGGQLFPCLKFRSMVRDSDAKLKELLESDEEARAEWESTQKLKNDPRVHFIGNLLRKSSLDEFPQLINVLRGEMSIVGPRPIVENEVPRYGSKIGAYYAVRPGLTGLWQVSGRSDTSYDRRVELDTKYVATASLWQDIKILFKTVHVVLNGSGSY